MSGPQIEGPQTLNIFFTFFLLVDVGSESSHFWLTQF